MTYDRQKVAPWERYTDGEWHVLRDVPAGEPPEEGMRQYRRHMVSARTWAEANGFRSQISRRDNGRYLRVRFTRKEGEDVRDWLRTRSRGQIGINFMVALQLLEYALHLRMFGENAPGGSETWAQFDRDAEMFLRMIKGGDE